MKNQVYNKIQDLINDLEAIQAIPSIDLNELLRVTDTDLETFQKKVDKIRKWIKDGNNFFNCIDED